MSDDRQTLNIPPVDQTTRGTQGVEDEPVQTEEDVVAALRRQVNELEERDRRRDAEIAEEKKRAAEERRRREQAESQARDAGVRAEQATNAGRQTVEEAQLSEISTALESRNAQMASLKSAYNAAFSEGAGDKMAELNSQMAILGAQIVSLDAGKAQLEQRRKMAPPTPPTPSTPSRDDLVRGMTRLERDWADQHPQYFSDPSFQQRAAAAANYAIQTKGLPRDSQEYIDFVNQELGLVDRSPPPAQEHQNGAAANQPAGRTADSTPSTPPASDRRMVAAPAGGSVPNTSRSDGEVPIYLTREDKEMARIQGVSEQEWARHKRDLIREGLIGSGARNRP